MSWYDHATMMALRLGRWADEPAPRRFEAELAAMREQLAAGPEPAADRSGGDRPGEVRRRTGPGRANPARKARAPE